MELVEFTQKISSYQKGSFITIETQRQAKKLKKYESLDIQKYSKNVVRLGCQYSNLQAVKEKHINDIDFKTQLPDNLEWVKGYENILLYNKKTKEYSVRVETTNHSPIVKWFLNGVETAKTELLDYLLSSEKQSKSSNGETIVFNVKLKDLVRLGNFA